MERAACWIGSFHSHASCMAKIDEPSALPILDLHYFAQWADRTLTNAALVGRGSHWLNAMAEHYRTNLPVLFDSSATIVHGDLYANNVLSRGDDVLLIDWGMAMIGPGAIDIASLIERWPKDIAWRCGNAYAQARWPAGAPPHFSQSMEIAQLYLLFRWMGESRSGSPIPDAGGAKTYCDLLLTKQEQLDGKGRSTVAVLDVCPTQKCWTRECEQMAMVSPI